MSSEVPTGSWVELAVTLLPAGERMVEAADTAATPLVARVRGFSTRAAHVGEECEVVTLAGRLLSGQLVETEPGHHHGFGRTQSNLVEAVARLKRGMR